MRLGLIHINMGPMSRPGDLVQAARAAEQAGFDSVWAGEHLVLPDPQVPPSPMAPQDPVLDSLLALTWAAAHTATIRLATGIVILPQRNPVLLAKQVATLDVLSGGRVTLGVGAGYLEPEFRAVGANFAERGAVTDEYLDAMRAPVVRRAPGVPRPVRRLRRRRRLSASGAAADPAGRRRAQRPGLPAGRRPRPRLVRLLADARPGRRVAGRPGRGRRRRSRGPPSSASSRSA